MTQINIIARLDAEPDEDNAASYTGADEDQSCAAYVDSAVHDNDPDEFIEFVVGEDEAASLVHTGSSTNYHKFETEGGAIYGLYVGRDEFDGEEPPEDLSISLAEADESDFEEVSGVDEDEVDALLGGSDDDSDEEEVTPEDEVDALTSDD